VARITRTDTWDAQWAPDLEGWTDGRPVSTWRYVRQNKGIGTVLDLEDFDSVDFGAGYDEEVGAEIDDGNHYRLWVFDLERETATPVEGMDQGVAQFHWANFGDRTFAFMPYDEWGRTRMYEIDVDNASATELFNTVGWIYEWVRVR